MKKTFNLREIFWSSFSKVKQKLLFFIGFTLFIIFVSLFVTLPLNIYSESIKDTNLFGYTIIILISFLLSFLISAIISPGIVTISLKASRGESVSFNDFLGKTKYVVRIMVANVIYFILITIGFLLLIVPGLFVLIRLQFIPYLIVDKNMGAIEAIKESYQITKGNTLKLFVLNLIVVPALVILGFLLLVVGVLFAIPMVYLMYAMVYDKLQQLYFDKKLINKTNPNTVN